MSKLLIYIGENKKFDVDVTVNTIKSLRGVSNARTGEFIGAIFECEYTSNGQNTVVRMSPDSETITVEGLGDESIVFALELQQALTIPLHAIDMEYTFNLALSNFRSVSEFKQAMQVASDFRI